MRRKHDRPISQVIEQYIHSSENILQGISSVDIEEIYKLELGEVIFKYTSSIELKKDTLHIKLTSAPLRAELLAKKERLIDVLNQRMGCEIIKKVIIR